MKNKHTTMSVDHMIDVLIYDEVSWAVDYTVHGAVRDAVYLAVGDAVGDAVGNAVGNTVRDEVFSAMRDLVKGKTK